MNVIYICKAKYKYNMMEQHLKIGEHPNSAFTRVRQRQRSQSNFNDLTTNQTPQQIVPKKLSTRQIAFREIKKLFCAGR